MTTPSTFYDHLKSIVHLSMTSLPVHIKLDRMLHSLSEAFPSARCLLLRPEEIIDGGFFYSLASENKPLWIQEGDSFNKENVLPEEEGILCPTFTCIPLKDETSFQGILYVGFSTPHRFSPEEKELLPLMADVMSEVIRNDYLSQKAEETISELKALHEMGKSVSSTLKLENLFPLIITTGLKILKAKGGVLRIEDKRTKELKLKWSEGNYHQYPLDEKIAKRVFYSQTPLAFNHFGEEKPAFSILCAPLLSQGNILGTLAFYDKDGDSPKFDRKDFQLFLMMVDQLSLAMANALTHYEISNLAQENEKRVAQLSSLWELNKALLTTVNFERILHLTLTAITIGEGLKFNRAMLFLVNEKDRLLEGTIAVGPDNAEEAGRIWNTLSQGRVTLSDRIAELTPPSHSHLNDIVKGIRISLEQEQCILSRTVLEGKSFNVQSPQSKEGWLQTRCERGCRLGSEMGCYVGEHLSQNPRVYSFATVPLMGKGKVIGVILVDNLYNQNPITEEDLHFLSMFSNQAGLAIENAILYRNLEQVHQELKETQNLLIHREKMVALGELSNSIAHEIKNPLVSIGGFARRLYRTLPDDTMEKQYTRTIVTEVARVEKILTDIFNYTHDDSMAFKPCNIQDILEDSLSLTQGKISTGSVELVKDFHEEVPQIHGDHHQLRQAFSNLIHNAYQALRGEGTLFLRLHPVSKNGTSFVQVEIGDTGGGIDPENLHHIFNPFYTTKDTSLGLGLPIVHKIITFHRGQIEVDNHPGKGVNFIITLPALEQVRESRSQAAEDNP